VAELLEASVASVNSALQRARATLRERLPERAAEPTEGDLAVLRRYMDAVEGADLAAVAALLAEDGRATMPPFPMWFQGRAAVMAALAASWNPDAPGYVGRFRMVATRANGRPAVAGYVRGPGEREHHAFAIGVMRIEEGRIVEMTAFHD